MTESKYCSTKFKCGEDLDAALEAALCAGDCAKRAEEAAERAEAAGGGGVTAESIKSALGYTPADEAKVSRLSEEKVDTVQGAENVGKFLGIGTDGKVAPVDAPSGGGAAGDGGVYELIDTITFTEAAALDMSAEPDGTPYAFDAFFITGSAEVGSGGGDICFNFNGSSSEWSRGYVTAATSAKRAFVAELYVKRGRWVNFFGDGNNHSVAALQTDSYSRALQIVPKDYSRQYVTRVFTKFTFAAGTVIKIYGVRHKGV